MIRKEEVYKIGIFNKPHGIHGELSFTFTDDIFDRVEAEYLICLLDGIFVPFFIEEYRFRSDTTALVKLEGVDTAERARMFTNIEVYFPVKHAEEAGPGELSWDFFVGFRMEEIHYGKLGEVTDVDTATLNSLFVVDFKGEELLIFCKQAPVEPGNLIVLAVAVVVAILRVAEFISGEEHRRAAAAHEHGTGGPDHPVAEL